MDTLPLAAIPGGLVVAVRLTPRAGRDALDGVATDAAGRRLLRARVTAPPADGRANDALIALLAAAFGVPRRALAIEAGESARIKRVRVAGDAAALGASLARALGVEGNR